MLIYKRFCKFHNSLNRQKKKKHRDKKRDKDKEVQASLMVACLKRLLPVGLNLFAGREQELVQHCKDRFLKKMPEYEISEFAKTQLTLPDKIDPADEMSWQHYLYSKLGQKKDSMEPVKAQQLEDVVARITDMAKVLYGLHMVSEGSFSSDHYFLEYFAIHISQMDEASSSSERIRPIHPVILCSRVDRSSATAEQGSISIRGVDTT